MIVEDSAVVRRLLAHIVSRDPRLSLVAAVGSAEEALRELPRIRPDVISMDIRLPGMDGLEFARRFRRLPKHRDIPVILITVVGDEPIRQAALEAGVIDFLVKPIRPRELRARCYNLLQLRQQAATARVDGQRGERVGAAQVVLDLAQARGLTRRRYQLAGIGAEPIGSTPAELDSFRRAEIAKWQRVVKEAGLSLD